MIVDGGVDCWSLSWFVRVFFALVWCFFRLNLGELGLIVGVGGLFGCVVDGE